MQIEVGAKYSFLVVVSLEVSLRKSGQSKLMAKCACDCGNVIFVERQNLITGNTKRCSDCARISRSLIKKVHGHSDWSKMKGTLEYKCYYTWQAMKRRCQKEYDKRYSDYGGRGIEVCERWQDYEMFLADMGPPPSMKHQIDRIDNNGHYEPSNCKWVTRIENSRNKRNSRFITAFGETLTQAEWSEKTGIKRETIAMRLNRGWNPEQALTLTKR